MMEYYLQETFRINADTSLLSTAVLLCCLTLLLVYLNTRRDPRLPPGPKLYPIIGNLPSLLGQDAMGNLDKIRKKYGDVFGLYIGTELTVFLNGYDLVHSALVKQGSRFSQRPISNFHKLTIKYPGIIFMNGVPWKEQRSFALNSLREICFRNGGVEFEKIVYQEIDSLHIALQESNESIFIEKYFYTSVANIACMVLYRHRFEFNEIKMHEILNSFTTAGNDLTKMTVLSNCFPYLYYFPGDLLGVRSIIKKHEDIRKKFMPLVSKSSFSGPCVFQMYLEAIESNRARPDSSFTPEQLKSTLFDLLVAGFDTSHTTMHWAILHLVRNQDVQEKMFEEIKSVIGVEHKPTIKDKVKLPYCEAVILETLRVSAVSPLGIPHTVTRDTTLSGYLLPENCTIVMNLHSCLKDPSVWKDPEEFRPERFLNHDGTKVVIPNEFIPFSAGPRSCIGETVAKLQIFLLLTTLIQKFSISPEVEGVLPKAEGQLGLVFRPFRFAVRITKR